MNLYEALDILGEYSVSAKNDIMRILSSSSEQMQKVITKFNKGEDPVLILDYVVDLKTSLCENELSNFKKRIAGKK